jgi:hypothetical protein
MENIEDIYDDVICCNDDNIDNDDDIDNIYYVNSEDKFIFNDEFIEYLRIFYVTQE